MAIKIKNLNDYVFSKHSVVPGTQLHGIGEVSRKHVGLHSARIGSPYTALCSRVREFTPPMLNHELHIGRTLIKLRCMRTTLHIVPFDVAAFVHMATFDLRVAELKRFFKGIGISLKHVHDCGRMLVDAVSTPIPPPEIEKHIGKFLCCSANKRQAHVNKKVLKYLWEIGVLCYVNCADNWEREERKYAITGSYYPYLNLDAYDAYTAQELLILKYVANYGPATIADMAWWSGLGVGLVRRILFNNRGTLAVIEVEGFTSEFYMTKQDYEEFGAFDRVKSDWVTLLAYEDPSLKGYYESRFRYVRPEDYNSLFNQIGEVRASVILNGSAIGTWTWNKKSKEVEVSLFKKVGSSVMDRVERLRQEYTERLDTSRQRSLGRMGSRN